jgi:DNA-binding SARP family transcriptional activator
MCSEFALDARAGRESQRDEVHAVAERSLLPSGSTMSSRGQGPEVRVLAGTVSVTRIDGSTEEPAGNMARLLALLVSRADQPVSVSEIIGAVWPDVDPDLVSRQQVERLVSGLRELLGEGARGIVPVRKHDRYRLDAGGGDVWVDSVEFERLARAARTSLTDGDAAAARRLAMEATALWRSDPVVLPDAWGQLRSQHRTVLLVGAEAAIRAGEPARAAAELASFVHDHPEDEAGWTLLVEAHIASGERVLAAQACAQARRALAPLGGTGPKLADLSRSLEARPDVVAVPTNGGHPATAPARRPTGDATPSAAPSLGPSPAPAVQAGPRRRRRLRIGVALLGALVAAGLAAVLIVSGDSPLAPALVKVYNLEVECQRTRIRECSLGLARDPYARYTAANVDRRVWHNDVLRAECYVPDGARVESEDGRPTTRWYRVTGVPGASPSEKAWLPAVRLRAGTEPPLPRCTGV